MCHCIYDWDFGDVKVPKAQTVTHAYDKPGQYEVRLVVNGIVTGCMACSYKNILVNTTEAVKTSSNCQPRKMLGDDPLLKSGQGVLFNSTKKQESNFDPNALGSIILETEQEYKLFVYNNEAFTSVLDISTKGKSDAAIADIKKNLWPKLRTCQYMLPST